MDRSADAALLALLAELSNAGYRFVAPTPETHRRVVARRREEEVAKDLRSAFGWSLRFDPAILPSPVRETLIQSGAVIRDGDAWRSRVRVSSLGDRLFLHSAYPTIDPDSVFFGPDSYRFAAFLRRELPRIGKVRRLVDLGCGAGVGGLAAAPFLPDARLTLTDSNPLALRLARINARHAGVEAETLEGDGLAPVSGLIDLVIANPPFIADPGKRTYRDGGDMHGAALSLAWALAAAGRIEPGGRILLYTGSAIAAGRDRLHEALQAELPVLGCSLRYEEIDPDIFGEQLDEPAYRDVERIAAVGAVIERAQV